MVFRTTGANYFGHLTHLEASDHLLPADLFLDAAANGMVSRPGVGYPVRNGLVDRDFAMPTAEVGAQILPRDATHVLWLPTGRA